MKVASFNLIVIGLLLCELQEDNDGNVAVTSNVVAEKTENYDDVSIDLSSYKFITK